MPKQPENEAKLKMDRICQKETIMLIIDDNIRLLGLVTLQKKGRGVF